MEEWKGTKQIEGTARMVNRAKEIRELISWLSDKIKRIALVKPTKQEEQDKTPNAQELLEEVEAKFGKQNLDTSFARRKGEQEGKIVPMQTRQNDEAERGA